MSNEAQGHSDETRQKWLEKYCELALGKYRETESAYKAGRYAGGTVRDESREDEDAPGEATIRRWITEAGLREEGSSTIRVEAVRSYLQDNEPDPTEEFEADPYYSNDKYRYVEETDEYILYNVSPPAEIPGDEFREVIRLYSDDDETRQTVEEVCMATEKPRELVLAILAAQDKIHASPRYTDEELEEAMEEGDMDHLVKGSLESYKRSYKRELQSQKFKEIRRAAEKWWDLESKMLEFIREGIADIDVFPKPAETVGDYPAQDDKAALFCFSDIHWGERGWRSDYSIQDITERFNESYQKLLDRTLQVTHPEKIYLGILGDVYHVDTYQETTSRGTELETSDSAKEIYREGTEAILQAIETLRTLAPMEIICVDGNHDRITSHALQVTLEQIYSDHEDVEISEGVYDLKFSQYEENLLAFSHGDRFNKTDYSKIIAREAKKLWADTSNRYWFEGHKHEERVDNKDRANLQIVKNPALAPQSEYERSKAYKGRRGMNSYVFDPDEGRVHMPSVRLSTPE